MYEIRDLKLQQNLNGRHIYSIYTYNGIYEAYYPTEDLYVLDTSTAVKDVPIDNVQHSDKVVILKV